MSRETLIRKIQKREALVAIMGLGYVGLPIARAFTHHGYKVLGFDIDARKIEQLTNGRSYIKHITPETLRVMREHGFEPTADPEQLRLADAILLCVPTPLTPDEEPDLRYVHNSVTELTHHLRPDQLVVLESTTYPGTTRQTVLPLLESQGLKVGHNLFLAYSPEREDPGSQRFHIGAIPKVVGAIDENSLEVACALYQPIVKEVVPVDNCEVAEACKLLENTYRAVNIALVNELKVIYERLGISIWDVIAAASTKPFGFEPFYPGPGLGGHCIPIDPFYLSWLARQHGLEARFVRLAGEVNTSMPTYVVGKITSVLEQRVGAVEESHVLILGMAYKKDVDDPRESPGFEIMDQLLSKGIHVSYHDPYISHLPKMRNHPELQYVSEPLTAALLHAQDVVVVVTDHSVFDWDWIVSHSQIIVDTRNATTQARANRAHVVLS